MPSTPPPAPPGTHAAKPADTENAHNWATQTERGNMLALRVMTWIALHLGRRISRWVLVFIVAYFYISSPTARRASRDFLARIPGQSYRAGAVFKHLYCFAAVTLDRVYWLNGRMDLFDVQIKDTDNQALGMASQGVGLFLMGAHMGSFDSVRSIARQHPDLKMILLMYEDNARNIKQLLHAINPAAQQEIISLGNANAMLQVRDQLAAGALIGVLADRSIGSTGNVELPLLGAQASFPQGPFRLAAMLKHPVFFMVGIYHGGNKYTIHLEPVMDFSKVPPAERAASAHLAMVRYVELIEHYCTKSPYNWFNFFDFWQKNQAPT
jgi:predicted LPLAT superfamily acyltransferase